MAWLRLAWAIIKAAYKFGAKQAARIADWVWSHKKTILGWASKGYTAYEIMMIIARILGIG